MVTLLLRLFLYRSYSFMIFSCINWIFSSIVINIQLFYLIVAYNCNPVVQLCVLFCIQSYEYRLILVIC